MTTLISMIGKGKVVGADDKQQNKGYEKVTYIFKNGKTVSTSCSTNAILASEIFPIDKVVMIGTTTSAWAELLDNPSEEELDAYVRLFDDCEQKRPFDVNGELARTLKALLKKRWNVQNVSFIATAAELTSETASDIYRQYVEKCLGTGRNVVLDVTHGLRWMPMFITSAIRYKEMVEHGLDSMRLLYAEIPLGDNLRKVGAIRELDALWDGQKTAEAMSLYFDKFDPDALVALIPETCSRLKEAMENFGNSMQADFLMPLVWDREDTNNGDYPLGKTVKQLRNGIKDVDKLEPCTIWLDAVASEMRRWIKKLEACSYPSERLLVLADMYAERRLWGQAIMALDVALRIFACEQYQPKVYPDWDKIGRNLDMLMNDLKQRAGNEYNSIKKDEINDIHNLMHTRNMIAHGNLNSVHDVSKTQIKPNLSKQYPLYRAALAGLFNCRH